MILVDTSVWVEHLRQGEPLLADCLESGQVLIHPFIRGELACGNLKNRSEVLELLGRLPGVPLATDDEVLAFIDRHQLMGRGIGYIDVHLLASSLLASGVFLWTRDRRLASVAESLKLNFAPHR